MNKSDMVAACNYFDEAIWPLVNRVIGELLDVNAKEKIADALSKAFVEVMEKEARNA